MKRLNVIVGSIIGCACLGVVHLYYLGHGKNQDNQPRERTRTIASVPSNTEQANTIQVSNQQKEMVFSKIDNSEKEWKDLLERTHIMLDEEFVMGNTPLLIGERPVLNDFWPVIINAQTTKEIKYYNFIRIRGLDDSVSNLLGFIKGEFGEKISYKTDGKKVEVFAEDYRTLLRLYAFIKRTKISQKYSVRIPQKIHNFSSI